MALPDTYSALYPGRFIKADMLKGQKVTLVIAAIDIEVLEGEKGKKPKVVVTLAGGSKKIDYVMPPTNGFCLKRMFGNNPQEWIGRRVTWYPTTTMMMGERVDCIRVWGSPDIAAEMKISIPQGRKKPLEAIMHKIMPGECGFNGTPNVAPQAASQEPIELVEVGFPDEEVGETVYFDAGVFADQLAGDPTP